MLNVSQRSFFFQDGIFRADFKTAPAGMTEIFKNQYIFFKYGKGTEPADIHAFFAENAFCKIDFRNRCNHRFFFIDGWMKEKMDIGFFHITVKQLDPLSDGEGKVS